MKILTMQRERDEFRRTLALINSVVTPAREDEASPVCDRRIITLLRNAGFTSADGRAMQSIIASAELERLSSPSKSEAKS